MLESSVLPRKFIFDDNKAILPLPDPDPTMTPAQVKRFYADRYPVLTSAYMQGPEMVEDAMQYTFVSVVGTKG